MISAADHHTTLMTGEVDEEGAFCQGMGRVMLPGFQWSFSPSYRVEGNSCILWLFTNALVNTRGKYAAAVIGSYLLGLAFELFRAGRVRFAKGEYPFQRFKQHHQQHQAEAPQVQGGGGGENSQTGASSPPSLLLSHHPLFIDMLNALSYMVQVALAYCIMLLVMLYEAMIFIAIIMGLGAGYFLVLHMNRRCRKMTDVGWGEQAVNSYGVGRDHVEDSDTGAEAADSPGVPEKKDNKEEEADVLLDHTHQIQTPCCANA